jgi:predicted DNA-binding transcriptional regulator AlpA
MLIKTPAAAEYLGVSVAFLEKRRVYGDGPRFVKLGRAVAYRRADLDVWIETRTRRSTSEEAAA